MTIDDAVVFFSGLSAEGKGKLQIIDDGYGNPPYAGVLIGGGVVRMYPQGKDGNAASDKKVEVLAIRINESTSYTDFGPACNEGEQA
jgi:hypothetical protein